MSALRAEPVACCAALGAPGLSDEEAAATADVFRALADPARVRIVNVLATSRDPVCVCDLIAPVGLSQPTVSHHLKKLTDAGLLEREQRGKRAYFSLKADAVAKLAAVVDTVTEDSEGCGCGSGSCCAEDEGDPGDFGEALYDAEQRGDLPDAAVLASVGCGNPTAVADLHEGETVLDLGSGGGIDVILSARRVGPTGIAYGLDMTDEMLAPAERNARDAGTTNVHFLKGLIEQIPLPADSIDVVISNCVINLSTDKPAVLTKIARVLKPGGRIGISDIVAEDRLTADERADRGSHVGCIAGALSKGEYAAGLEAAGFEQVSIVYTHEVADGMHGAIVKAVKTETPEAKGLPVIQPAAKAGCC